MSDSFSRWLDEQYPAPVEGVQDNRSTGGAISQWLEERCPTVGPADEDALFSSLSRFPSGFGRKLAQGVVIAILFAGFGLAVPYIIYCIHLSQRLAKEEKSDAERAPETPKWFAAVAVNGHIQWATGKPYLIRVQNFRVGDEWLANLENLDSLKELHLPQTGITSVGLLHLKKLVRLRELDLRNNPITDEGLKQLAGMTRLTYLDLSGTQITDEGLKSLHGMNELKSLDVTRTAVTRDGASAFEKSHPNCHVGWLDPRIRIIPK